VQVDNQVGLTLPDFMPRGKRERIKGHGEQMWQVFGDIVTRGADAHFFK